MARLLRLASTVAGVAALVCAGSTAEVASAATYPTTVASVSSSDGNARGTATITWMSATHFTAYLENCDRKADGRGAIFYLYYLNSFKLGYEVAYDHVLTGNGSCDYYSAEARPSNDDISGVQLRECNGGSKAAPQRCQTLERTNPLNGG